MVEFTVDTLSDETFGGGSLADETNDGNGLSLREAIALANASSGADTIQFADGLTGLIRLTEGEIVITDAVSIDGGGLVTITGDTNANDETLEGGITDVAASLDGQDVLADNSRIFNVTEASAETTLKGLTLTGGRTTADGDNLNDTSQAGGAVRSLAGLTIEDSTISGNSTAGDRSGGGGVFTSGAATLTNSTINGNSTAGNYSNGGGLYSESAVTLTNSTVSGNSTTGLGSGGGVFTLSAVTLTNSTINGNSTAGNYSGGGGVSSFGAVKLTNSTISGNRTAGGFSDGGGVFAAGEIELTNSIVLGNKALQSVGDELHELTGDGLFSVNGANIIGGDSSAFDTSQIIGAGTAINASATDVFAETTDNNGVLAGGLADNGGPVQTIALLDDASNPALNASGADATPADARGVTADGGRDLGAYEVPGPASLIVTTTDDVVNGVDGVTSLREAVLAANALDGADEITFAAGVQGLIRLTEGEIEITDAVSIDGGGLVTITGDADANDVTLEGGITNVAASLDGQDLLADNSRIFNVTEASAETTLSNLTLTGGRTQTNFSAGGAVSSVTDVKIEGTAISGNSTAGDGSGGGGVFSQGAVTSTNSSINGNSAAGSGGGVYSYGAVTLTNSTISGNSTAGNYGSGGGVYSYGAVTLTNSTISGNSTAGDFGYGGGVYSYGAVTLTNSTISGNSTAGDGSVGGGVAAAQTIEVTNSIILGNKALQSVGDELNELFGDDLISVTGTNIIGANGAAFDTSQITGAGTADNASATDVFAETAENNGVLADNGGPVQTIALRGYATNPALDTSDPATATLTDARGFAARDGSALGAASGPGLRDLGAYEAITDPTLIVTSLSDGINAGDGVTTLREAVAYANARSGADSIEFADGLTGLIRLTGGEIEITDAVTIDGGGLVTITGDTNGNDETLEGGITDVAASLDGQDVLADNSRIFNVTEASAETTLSGLTLTGGRTTADGDDGGAVSSDAELTIEDSAISGNSTAGAAGYGGGVYSKSAVTLTSSTISGNSTAGENSDGGGVYSRGVVTLTNSTINGNSTAGDFSDGGGVYANGAVTLTNSTISGNSTAGENSDGGGIYSQGAVTLTNSTISGNSTAGENSDGGGVAARDTIEVTNSIVLGNKALQSDSDELNERFGDGLISVTGTNIIGGDSSAFDTSQQITGAGTADNALATDVFAETTDNNGVLADNGGSVQTIALLDDASNPALNASGADATPADARGVTADGGRDLGAYEVPGPASLIVTTTDDVVSGVDGVTSLREAVLAANALDGADAITFAAGVQGLIRLTGGEIEITDAVSIDGGGLVTITGDADANDETLEGGITDVAASLDGQDLLADNSRIFNVTEASAETTLSGLTLTGGRTTADGDDSNDTSQAGGAVRSLAELTIKDSTISGNSTAGDNSAGGGVFTSGAATLTNSTISGNSAAGDFSGGGGVFTSGDATLTNSTISGNSTAGYYSFGGGVYSQGAVKLTNSTISGNSTAGRFSEGGGVADRETTELTNSIVLGNKALQSADDELNEYFGDARISVTGTNIIGANSEAFDTSQQYDGPGTAINASATDVFAQTANNNGALAGVLADNGGPVQTIALKATPSNPAVDAASGAGFDARGEARGVDLAGVDNGGTSDLGALELQISDDDTPPVITSNLAISVAEGTSSALSAVPVTATDVTAVTFSIAGGPDAGAVSIDAVTGALSLAAEPDFEAPGDANGDNTFEVIVQAADENSNAVTNTVTITVTDVNEPTAGDDTLIGTALNDRIDALAGNDNVTGLAGDDLLFGRGGDDSLRGSAGDDSLRGNGGDDTLRGNGGDDNIKGNAGEDFIRGNGGDDVIRAGGAADNVKGGGGADLIFGGGGADDLRGGGGADTIRGNGGDDTLKGNGGADVFQFRISDRNDTIVDFRQGQDRIEIQNGAQSFDALDIEQDGRDVLIGFGVAGQIRVVTDNAGAFDESDFIF